MTVGQTQQEINIAIEQIVDGHRGLFERIRRPKVEPVYIQTEAGHTPMQQKKRPKIPHYKGNLRSILMSCKWQVWCQDLWDQSGPQAGFIIW